LKHVRYHPEARQELLDAVDWYDEHARLGEDFLAKAIAAEHAVAKHQGSFPLVQGYEPLRGARLDRCPFRLIYAPAPDGLVVLAVAHDRREPGSWSDRLEDES
jgi:hypothetical protein